MRLDARGLCITTDRGWQLAVATTTSCAQPRRVRVRVRHTRQHSGLCAVMHRLIWRARALATRNLT